MRQTALSDEFGSGYLSLNTTDSVQGFYRRLHNYLSLPLNLFPMLRCQKHQIMVFSFEKTMSPECFDISHSLTWTSGQRTSTTLNSLFRLVEHTVAIPVIAIITWKKSIIKFGIGGQKILSISGQDEVVADLASGYNCWKPEIKMKKCTTDGLCRPFSSAWRQEHKTWCEASSVYSIAAVSPTFAKSTQASKTYLATPQTFRWKIHCHSEEKWVSVA